MSGDRLSVKTICKLTGINEHTLRAWERRYQIVEPERLENGRRVYSLDDLEKLKLINKLLNNGFLIGHIASYSDRELSKLLHEINHRNQTNGTNTGLGPRICTHLLAAVKELDVNQLQKILEKHQIECGVRFMVYEVCLPLMTQMEDELTMGDLQLAHMQLMYQILRNYLSQAFYSLSIPLKTGKPQVRSFASIATHSNHVELETLMASLICALNEFPIHFFGKGLQPNEVASVLASTRANTLLLGADAELCDEAFLDEYIESLAQNLEGRCEVWIYRACAYDGIRRASLPVRLMPNLQVLDESLAIVR